MQKRTDQLKRGERPKRYDDGETVRMKWYCGICQEVWEQYTTKGKVRSMPSYVTIKGKRIETRRPDGSMLLAHEECAQKMLDALDEAAVRMKGKKSSQHKGEGQ